MRVNELILQGICDSMENLLLCRHNVYNVAVHDSCS